MRSVVTRRARIVRPLWVSLLSATLVLALPAAANSSSARSVAAAAQLMPGKGKSRRPAARLSKTVLQAALKSFKAHRIPKGLTQPDRVLLRRVVRSLLKGNQQESRALWRAFVKKVRGAHRGPRVRAAARWVFYQSVLKPNPKLCSTLKKLNARKARRLLIRKEMARVKAALRKKRQAKKTKAARKATQARSSKVESASASSDPVSATNVMVRGGEVLDKADEQLVSMLEELGRQERTAEQAEDELEGTAAAEVADIAARNQSIQNTISAASRCVSTAKTIDQKMTGKMAQ